MVRFTAERLEKIIDALREQILCPKVHITRYRMLETDQRDLQNANTGDWQEFDAAREHWSGFRKYCWFIADIEIPPELAGAPAALLLSTGAERGWDLNNPQIYVYVDGELAQGVDINHRTVLLTSQAEAGRRMRIALFAYTSDNDGFLRLDTWLCGVNTAVKDLYFDMKVPYQTALLLEEDDKRRLDLLEALNTAANRLDLRRVPSAEFQESIEPARAELAKRLPRVETPEAVIRCVGHSHIDLAWLWTLDVTRQKAVRTFSGMLRLMEKYPEFIFTASQAPLYKWVKEDAPEVYAQIKQRIAEGRWDPEGAMYVEADCNLTSGESLARQLLYGKRFFMEELGVDSKVLWLPDVFGYSAALPQMLRDVGVDYFMTTKISWNEYNKFPFDSFYWRGIDGTEILTHFIPATDFQPVMKSHFTTYNGMLNPSQVKGAWQRYQQKLCGNEALFAFGHGDGGGGPTAEMLENARRMNDGLPGLPAARMTTVRGFFEDLERDARADRHFPYWSGELYFEYHRGTYTSQAQIKRDNRRAEFLLTGLEKLATAAMLAGGEYPGEVLERSWQTVMLNQFHDIIPGSSIREVYEDSARQFGELFAKCGALRDDVVKQLSARLAAREDGVAAVNLSGLRVSDVVTAPLPQGAVPLSVVAADDPDLCLPVQVADGQIIFFAPDIPANGYRTFLFRSTPVPAETVNVTETGFETPFYSVVLDGHAQIVRLYDKQADRELLKAGGLGNELLVYEDRPYKWEAWDINTYYDEHCWTVDDVQCVEVLEQGPVRGRLRVTRRCLDSVIVQEICVYANLRRIDFHTVVQWRQNRLLLKAAFPVDIHAEEAAYEIQYGNVTRPTHRNTSWDDARFEVCAHKWADLSENGYGVSLLNDCKYGHDIHDGVIKLTLLKSATYPDPQADQGRHEFTYSLLPHTGGWRDADTVPQAYALNNPVLPVALEGAATAAQSTCASLVETGSPNVIVEAVKKAEDSDAVVVRLYECHNRRTSVTLRTAFPVRAAWSGNLLEQKNTALETTATEIRLEMKPYEIRTVIIEPA